ncbi:unnamed protein product [Psylliodes chrysocephalus]|uniref:Protein sleepless n=1 Tax=Psylliodes chrysocephalus TaxID=3402493 RepID=A0A9P0CUW1_9CUCU|nr:unnamed protein product [Psylliodes chrysocephala]
MKQNMSFSSIVGLLFVFSIIMNTGLALVCFSCDSKHKDNSSCRDSFMEILEPYDELPKMVHCRDGTKNEKAVCLKIKYMKDANNKTEVQRSCELVPKTLKEGHCPDDLIDYGTMEYCGICDMEACNASPGVKTVFLTPVTMVFLTMVKKLYFKF